MVFHSHFKKKKKKKSVGCKDSVSLALKQIRVQARSKGWRWSWALIESWTVICGSRRDQDEGGGAGPSREPKKRDQEQGGGLGSHREFGQSFASAVPQQLLFGHCLCDFIPHSR